ncbi:alpha/beta-hydrolase [Astrocystis sublimbata]|nr:alpha/beta-hydrolase [Astrocystis sublimbata]
MAPSAQHVTSADGTRIAYLTQGQGPGILLIQGAMADVHAYGSLAAALSSTFTVHSVERRGRGLSPLPYDEETHSISRDVEDIDAVLVATGARFVFGLSSGAVITLEAARTLPRIEAAAVFEPPFYANGISRSEVQRLKDDIARGDLWSALFDALIAADTAPGFLRVLPRSVGRLVAGAVLTLEERFNRESSTLRELLPGVRYDFHDVASVDGRMDSFAGVKKPVLVLSGSKSVPWLREAARTLHGVLPDAEHVEIKGAAHDGPWNGGKPGEVAAALQKFFGVDRYVGACGDGR